MNKAHVPVNWENYPSDKSPVNERNLNKMDGAIGIIDDNVVTLDATKATKTEVATLVADVTFEESTGIITITKKNGSKVTIDTQIEKIAVNFDYDPVTQQIILTLIDGTKQYIDLSALITQYEFLDSDTVAFYIDSSGKVSAIVKEGSIEEKHLEPNYLARIKVEVAKAELSQKAAATSEANAKTSEDAAKASETAAKTSETNAKASETAATKSATAAAASESNAKASETSASESAATATSEAASASQSAITAADKANIATQKASEIIGKAESAEESATKAQSYAVGGTGSREGEDSDNAKYYFEQVKDVSEAVKGGLQPRGTVAFADLPQLADCVVGWMFNISDEFTTTADFKEGAGNTVPAGANIYKTSDEKWDVLAGTPVTGVKGVKETSFRRGNVVITPENIGAYTKEAIDALMKNVNIPASQELLIVGKEDNELITEENSGWQTANYLIGVSESLKVIAEQLMTLNSSLKNKDFIKIVKKGWSGHMGSLVPMFNTNGDSIVDLIAHNEENDTYPSVRVARATADFDGNVIPDTYMKKSDINTNEFIRLRGYIDNANWAIWPGLYITGPETVDASDYGVLLAIGTSANGFTGGDWYFQVWFKTNKLIHVRRSINATGGGGWTAWETISKS